MPRQHRPGHPASKSTTPTAKARRSNADESPLVGAGATVEQQQANEDYRHRGRLAVTGETAPMTDMADEAPGNRPQDVSA